MESKVLNPVFRLLLLVGFASSPLTAAETSSQAASAYSFRSPADPDGTGKVYFGREIAQVMGHPGAAWLERSERKAEERTDLLLASLPLGPGLAVADIGAGSGYFATRLARRVGPSGKVFAVDIQPEMLQLLTDNAARAGISNIVTVLGAAKDPRLPAEAVDLALLVDVYHEFEFPREMMLAICRSLKPQGWVVLVEYRAEDPDVPIKPLHRMSVTQVRREMEGLPLKWVELIPELPRQHILVFQKAP